MMTPDPIPDESALDEMAAEWLFEREQGLAPLRAQEFADWCARDPRHRAAVARVEQTLKLLDEMPFVRVPVEAWAGAKASPALLGLFVRFKPWGWAAGLAAALAIGFVGWWVGGLHAPPIEVYTAKATEPRRIALADGSVVDLNAGSHLQVQFGENERRVKLSNGEAHFQVAHNAARPFIVSAEGISVRAVGTAFDVRLSSAGVDVLVVEGKVEVAKSALLPPAVSPPLLVAGERTQISPHSSVAPRIEKVTPAAMHTLLAWQDRMTSFIDVPLLELVARINRCNSTQLVIADARLGERKIGGVIALNQLDAFVHLLEQDGDIVAERRGAEIILKRAR